MQRAFRRSSTLGRHGGCVQNRVVMLWRWLRLDVLARARQLLARESNVEGSTLAPATRNPATHHKQPPIVNATALSASLPR